MPATNPEARPAHLPHALVFHGDHLEPSEQSGKDSGYEKSVRDLT
jgi:hypothetical protein